MKNLVNEINKKELIINAAKELFIEKGIDNVSMRNIAKKINYSPTTLYIYFSNKTDILKKLAEDYFRDYADMYEEILRNTEVDPLDNLKHYMKVYVERAMTNPGMYKLMTKLFAESESFNLGISNAGRGYEILVELTKRCIDAGEISAGQEQMKAQILWINTHGLCSLLASRPSFHWEKVDELIKLSINTIIKGMS
jgi:AcrR family transcriptional regulator